MDLNTDIEELKNLMKHLIASQEETAIRFKETDSKFKETDSKFKETDMRFRETTAQFKETDKRIKEAYDLFVGQWGKLMESLVEGDLINLLRARNMDVHRVSTRVRGNYEGDDFEFDIIAHNGNEIVIVEVKTTLKVKHVKEFVRDLKAAKRWMPEYADFNIFGAMAYLKADENSADFAEHQGLFVIRATGNSSSITNDLKFIPKAY